MNKKQKYEAESKGERKRSKEEWEDILAPRDKRLPLDREETEVVHRQRAVNNRKGRNLMFG